MKEKVLEDKTVRLIISELIKDGRIKYTTLAKKLKVTPAAVKERIERLIKNKSIKISALINTRELFPITSGIGVEADSEGVNILVNKLRNCPLVFHMTRTSGMHNLVLSVVTEDMQQLESFLNNQIRSEPGIKHVEVNIGNESTIVPDFQLLKLFSLQKDRTPCGLRISEKEVCLNCPGIVRKTKK